MADVAHRELAERPADPFQLDHLLVDLRVAVTAGAPQVMGRPRRGRERRKPLELALSPLAQGEEDDAPRAELIEHRIVRQLGVEDQQSRVLS